MSGFTAARDQALRAHATQVDPTSKFWFGLPPEVSQTVYPVDEYVLARSLVPTTVPESNSMRGAPVRMMSPGAPRSAVTTPPKGAGTSTTALAVSTETMG